ncbi:MAG: COG4223 family protein [Paracoccaceae bacterium]
MSDTDDLTSRKDDQAADAVAPPQDDTPKPAPQPNRRRGGFAALLLGGAIAAGLGFGAAQFVPQGWPLASTAELERKLADQANDLAQLQTRLAALEGQPAPDLSPLMDTLATLNSRVAALEIGPADRAEDTADLTAAVAALQADLAALQASGPVPANITALAAEAEARLQEAEDQANRLKAEAEALNLAAERRIALAALRAAVESGAPFGPELATLGPDVPPLLSQAAETGVPSLATLQDSFAEAARAALEAALRADMGDSWTDRAMSFFRTQTGARSLTPREGSDPDAILSRAEAALAKGDLVTTLAELDSLPEVARTAMSDWRAMADQRLQALTALRELAETNGG